MGSCPPLPVPSYVLTVLLSRITGPMFMTSGVLLVLGRTDNAGLAGRCAIALLGMVVRPGHAPDWTIPVVAIFYSVTRPSARAAS